MCEAKHHGHGKLELELFNAGGWLTHGDSAIETNTDVVAVQEHRQKPSRACDQSRLRQRRIRSVWAPVNKDSSHIGAAGVGIVR